MESQEPPRDYRNRVFFVVDVRHESGQVFVDEIGKVLVPDAGHAEAYHAHGHARIEPQPEEDPVEEGERCAERVADGCDGRRAVRREGTLDGRQNGIRGAASLFLFCQPRAEHTDGRSPAFLRPTASLELRTGRDPERNRCGL
jgi:hypothetical protein